MAEEEGWAVVEEGWAVVEQGLVAVVAEVGVEMEEVKMRIPDK